MFNIRVYGIYIENHKILVSDEYIKKEYMTKFPGGGLEKGEGTRDCLVREWREELHQKIATGRHLYTTDFYQESGFGDGSQVISIYYKVKILEPFKVPISDKPFDFNVHLGEKQAFRMIPIEEFTKDSVTLPIDKVVAKLIMEDFRSFF